MASTENKKRDHFSINALTNPLAKPLLLVALVLVLPVILLAFSGESFTDLMARMQTSPPRFEVQFLVTMGILAADIFLPVPSGPVSTLAGSQMGLVAGTLASTLGMSLGGIIAFSLARRWGRPLAERLAAPGQMEDLTSACERHGMWMMLVTRPLPIVAEAALLVVGSLGMSWGSFLCVLLASNFVLGGCYAALGSTASNHGWLPAAVCLSIAVPLMGTLLWKRGGKKTSIH